MKSASLSKSRSAWNRVQEDWAQSGLSQTQFCKNRGISYGAFCSQRNRRRKRGEYLPVPASGKSLDVSGEFLPVRVVPDAVEPEVDRPEVVVELPLGIVLRIRGSW